MALLTFKGGIHPNDGKSLAKDKAIKAILPTGELVYPLSQHIGAPATPVVQKGDQVLKGQKIAEAGGFVSAPIYASVSGTVKAIEPRFNPTGSKVNCIIIENDGEYKEVEYAPVKPFAELTKEEIELCYKSFYRPDNMMLVLAGPINVEETIKIIKENFKDYKNPKEKVEIIQDEEPDNVYKEYEEIQMETSITKLSLSYKMKFHLPPSANPPY